MVADPLTLLSLPDRVYRSGLAEAVKHGVIADAEYFDWIEHNAKALLARDVEALTRLVARSVEIKAGVDPVPLAATATSKTASSGDRKLTA